MDELNRYYLPVDIHPIHSPASPVTMPRDVQPGHQGTRPNDTPIPVVQKANCNSADSLSDKNPVKTEPSILPT